MATFSAALRQVKGQLDHSISEEHVSGICREVGHVWRNRLLNPAVTVRLFLLQLLAGVAMRGVSHVAQITVSAQAICRAKMRLPLKVLAKLVTLSAPDGPQLSLWRGLALYIADGMSFMTQDTGELARTFGKPKNQRGVGFGYPTPKLLALMDLGGGFIRKVIALPWSRQEYVCLSRLFERIKRSTACGAAQGALLLGDRGLVSFAHLALLMRAGIQGCFRLPRRWVVHGHRTGHRRTSRGLIRRLGKQDLLVCWSAYRRPAWLSEKRWEPLARQQLTLRQIAFRVLRKGHRPRWAWIITTLTDPKRYPAQELIDLYCKRWQIEVYFRDLKRTLGLRLISAKTVAGVRKEVLAFVLLYNLVRQVMREAAVRQDVEADRISFIDALLWLRWSSPGTPLPRLAVNPRRIRVAPPRRLKNARHRFPQLNRPRAELAKPPCVVRL